MNDFERMMAGWMWAADRPARLMERRAIRSGTPLDQLDFPALDPTFPADSAAVFSLDRALAARTNPGAPSPANVRAEIARHRGI